MSARLIWVTPEAEKTILYCARVSNPANQESSDTKLLGYCLREGHVSVFEQANMCVEVYTSRAVSAQMIRHKSLAFQEFSQRYAVATKFEPIQLRRQDTKNRQNSIDDLDPDLVAYYASKSAKLVDDAHTLYQGMVEDGIAKECARMVLPMTTQTKLYVNGNVRSWIHYLQVRRHKSTQLEHRQVADAIYTIFSEQFPTVTAALGVCNG